MGDKRYCSVEEAMKVLERSNKAIYRYLREGKLKGQTGTRILRSSVEKLKERLK